MPFFHLKYEFIYSQGKKDVVKFMIVRFCPQLCHVVSDFGAACEKLLVRYRKNVIRKSPLERTREQTMSNLLQERIRTGG